ncbi:hypothetical protein RJT34_10167 [Clitoria ternatea]|uniref:Uncharacterized protein n=1 Tax=Clitoria ternatea TaxID=43366 RepID=A0AAN9K6J8_CLITE
MYGGKPLETPKRRPKSIKKLLKNLSPGKALMDVSATKYQVDQDTPTNVPPKYQDGQHTPTNMPLQL